MKRAVLLLVLVLGGPPGVWGAEADFRQVRWGMTRAQVRAAEPAAPVNELKAVLIYRQTWLGLDTFLYYYFRAGRLHKAAYAMQNLRDSGEAYVADYAAIKRALTRRYGPPLRDEATVDAARPLGEDSVWKYALLLGDVSRHAVWRAPRTRVALTLREISHFLHFVVQFSAVAHPRPAG